jgi:hypothetical protein
MVSNGSSRKNQLLPSSQEGSGVAAEDPSAFIRTQNWLSWLADLNPLDCKLWVTCVEGHGLPKASQKPGEPEEILPIGRSRDSPGDSACGNIRLARMSQGLRRGIGWPF